MAYLNILATTRNIFSAASSLSLLILQKRRNKEVQTYQEIVIDFVDSLPTDKSYAGVKMGSALI